MRDKTIDQQLVKYLKSYTDMDDAALEEVVSNLPIKTFQKGDILLHQGQMAEYCIYVISGCVRQYRINEDGDEVTSEFIQKNSGSISLTKAFMIKLQNTP